MTDLLMDVINYFVFVIRMYSWNKPKKEITQDSQNIHRIALSYLVHGTGFPCTSVKL